MNILLVTDKTITQSQYGEIERSVWYLSKELDAMGHHVHLLAGTGSACPYAETTIIDSRVGIATQIPPLVDVVHFHSKVDLSCPKPFIATIHNQNMESGLHDRSIYTSRFAADRAGATQFIYNGIDWEDYGDVQLHQPTDYYHFMGNSSELKSAIRITKVAGNRSLKVLNRRRFDISNHISVYLSRRVKFYRNPSANRRLEVLRGSSGLIYPISSVQLSTRPFFESLFFGAAIYGSESGVMSEIVNHGGEFGVLSNDENEIARAVSQCDFSRSHCHQYALDCFNSTVMTIEYLKRYERVLEHNRVY